VIYRSILIFNCPTRIKSNPTFTVFWSLASSCRAHLLCASSKSKSISVTTNSKMCKIHYEWMWNQNQIQCHAVKWQEDLLSPGGLRRKITRRVFIYESRNHI
jgi:hypothetical protein